MTQQEQRRERIREEILEAAAAAIATRGFHGMTMRDLAKATDRSLASFYNYFPSKEQVLFALQVRAFENLIARSRVLVEKADDPAGRLYLFIANQVSYFMDHGNVMRVLVHEAATLPGPKRRRVRRLKERYFQLAAEIVADVLAANPGAAASDAAAIERATYNIFGMVNWVYTWYQPKRHGAPQDVIRTIHGMAMQGLQAMHLEASQLEIDALLEGLPSPVALPLITVRKGAA